MPKFEKGEIALAIDMDGMTMYECEIISTPHNHELHCSTPEKYIIHVFGCLSHHFSGYWTAYEQDLRKKKPPEEITTWEQVEKDTDWHPTKVREAA